MEKRRGPDKFPNYSPEQVEFVRMLAEREKCTTNMILELTSMPRGSLSGLTRRNNIVMPDPDHLAVGGPYNIAAIRRARRMSILRQTYGQQISELFGGKKDSGPRQE